MSYAYDKLGRPSGVTDGSGQTTYSYDAVGNLQSFAYPNGVTTTYTYNPLNRLTQMGASQGPTALSRYAYTLGTAGNRLSVAELSGRTVQYGYDDIYWLTSETIAGAASQNGTISYAYDAVGNRQQIASTLAAIPSSGTLYYDANDRTATETYDNDGNTVASVGVSNVYDFENHLVQHGNVTIVYDGDGNRVAETVGGATTKYLVDTQNPTGYAQVVDELQNGAVVRTYSYGLERISETQSIGGAKTTSFYGYDGHGSVRQLFSSTGAITDTYDYDAFGNLIASTGNTPNNYLFSGEQFDPALGLSVPAYSPAVNNTKVEVHFDEIKALHAAHHAYLLVRNLQGLTLVFRGGPSQQGGTGLSDLSEDESGSVRNSTDLGFGDITSAGSGAVFGPTGSGSTDYPKWPGDDVAHVDVPEVTQGFQQVVASFRNAARTIDNLHIPYHPASQNSNSFAHTLLVKAHLNSPTPPVWSPGWDHILY